ncbi:MAG TPA: TonB-dependent receptor plug domain-containing protein [Opitutus sp.]|nr:TonB-dependent receptor plug domain-containing protein [Opitutus sp.]
MNCPSSRLPARNIVPLRLLFAVVLTATPTASLAQSTSTAERPSAASPSNQDGGRADEVVVLSPFSVSAAEDEGYVATSTMAGTRIRTNLRDVGSAISVLTEQFFKDTGATSAESTLIYATNAEVGGLGGTMSGASITNYADYETQRYRPQTNTRIRGLASADLTRDLFLTDIPFNTYNTGRIDIQRGPNSLLFGLGSPAGIINNNLNQAMFTRSLETTFRFDQYGSRRNATDINYEILPQELAIRIDTLYDRTVFRQKPAFEEEKRLYATVNYQPKWLKFPGGNTTIRASHEWGDIDANRPRTRPLADQISPWFNPNGLNKLVVSPTNVAAARAQYPILGSPPRGAGNVVAAMWTDPHSDVQGGAGVTPYVQLGRNQASNTPTLPRLEWSSIGSRSQSVAASTAWGATAFPGFYKTQELLDPTVFNFFEKLIDGPNKSEHQEFDATIVSFEQTALDGDLGVEIAFDRQFYYSTADAATTGFGDGQALAVDINTHLINGDPNPNLGRPYISSDSLDNAWDKNTRKAFRATAFYAFDARKHMKDSFLTRLIGRHTLTGLYTTQSVHKDFRKWRGYVAAGQHSAALLGTNAATGLPNSGLSFIVGLHYLGESLLNRPTLAGANISNITAPHEPLSGLQGTYWNPAANGGAGAFVKTPFGIVSRYYDGKGYMWSPSSRKERTDIDSHAFVWQGHLLDGVVVPTIGWRQDRARAYNAGPPPINPVTNHALPDSPAYQPPKIPTTDVEGENLSWGVVVHSPKFINDRLPLGINFDVFFNKSDNFQPGAGRTDVFGRNHPPLSGQTKDYGFLISVLDNKFVLRVNKYDSAVQNDSVVILNRFYPGDVEAGYWDSASRAYNILNHPAAVAAWNANLPSELFQRGWAFSRTPTLDGFTTFNNRPGGGIELADTVSKGTEFELTYNPTPNWRISANAARQGAVRSNIGKDLDEWIAQRRIVWEGPAGDLEREGQGGVTLREYARANIIIPYETFKNQSGGPAQEVRKWRWNAITNYTFSDGALKGFSLGGGVRWQDKVAIGFPVHVVNNIAQFNVKAPYFGPSETTVDLWLGYERRLSRRVGWQIQLNVKNANIGDKLIPVYAQPDGTIGGARLAESRLFYLTNTFTF